MWNNLILVHVKHVGEELREKEEKEVFYSQMGHVFSSSYWEDLFLYPFICIAVLGMFTHRFCLL